jgi:endonuclease/exonuclease/phosphatase family metal-dependent hydrolase
VTIKLLTLNIEGDRHLERVRAVIAAHQPDIVCLQEVFEADCPYLAAAGGYHWRFALSALVRDHAGSRMRNWGVAMLARVPVLGQYTNYYADDPTIRVLDDPNDPRRVLVVAELQHGRQQYRVATTHFTWSARGDISAQQKADFSRLKAVLSRYPDYLLCGDFNAPRNREMFSMFTGELSLTDLLPEHITSTIDAQYHYAGSLELVVDTFFSTGEYQAADIRLLEGISDHKGILALVQRR